MRSVDVLIVTAADGEDAAVRAVTAGLRSPWWESDETESYPLAVWRCELQTPSGGVLAIALTPAAGLGVEATAHALGSLAGQLRPRCLAMSGVCAGRPGWSNLGDVIVADRVYRYDVGEVVNGVAGRPPVFHGDLMTYSFRLDWRQRAERWRGYEGADWLREKPRPRELQEDWLLREVRGGRNPCLSPVRNRCCPDWKEVVCRLLEGELIELDDAGSFCLTKLGIQRANRTLALHPEALPDQPEFRLHVGPLGTGSNLVRDVDVWTKLTTEGHERLLRGLDMEASAIGFAALVREIPWIVVKGVMDFAEPDRPQGFRAFAARAAAEVLLGFLRENLEPTGRADSILIPGTPTGAFKTNPASLLSARRESVPFAEVVRRAELDLLVSWCQAADNIDVRLFTGPGGTGKTRLFIEQAKRMRAAGWDAGFLPEQLSADDQAVLLASLAPTLVVVDYCETHRDLARFLEAAASTRREGRGKLRVALIAREVADWWSTLVARSVLMTDLLTRHDPYEVRPVAVESDARLTLFRRSVEAFAKILDCSPATALAADPDLNDERFGRVLYLQMAALAAVNGSSLRAGGLLSETVDHELRYWARQYRDEIRPRLLDEAGFKDQVSRLLAAATLHGRVTTREDAVQLSARAAGPCESRFPDVLRFAHGLYPGPAYPDGTRAYLGPLQPDLLGEELVSAVLRHEETSSDYLRNIFECADSDALRNAFSILGRLGTRVPEDTLERWARTLLDVDLPTRAWPAVEAALAATEETAHAPLPRALHHALEALGTIRLARELESVIPSQTVSLRAVGAWAVSRLLDSIRADSRDVEALAERARLANNLGVRLRELGQLDEALAATEEAVRIRRTLIKHDSVAFMLDLAVSLDNLGNRLSGVGRYRDALDATQEAVSYLRTLANARPEVLPELTASLNNLGKRFGDLGRRDEALAAIEEAVTHCRTLATEQPRVFLPRLAMALNNLGVTLRDAGRREEAVAAVDEAIRYYRKLAKERPDSFLPVLAGSLNSMGIVLGDIGQHEPARVALEEAVTYYRTLAQTWPDRFLPELATALNNLGSLLSDQAEHQNGLLKTDEAASIRRRLAVARPDAFLPALAESLNNLGADLSDVGRADEALAASVEAVSHYRTLSNARPEAFLPKLAGSLSNLSNRFSAQGRLNEALVAAEEAVSIHRDLAKTQPNVFLPSLASSLNNLGNRLSALGRFEDALAAMEEAVSFYRILARATPQVFRPALVGSLNNLARILMELGRGKEARAAAEESATIASTE